MKRSVRALLIVGAVFVPWWAGMAWWAVSVQDPIVPKVLSLLTVPFAVLIFIAAALPPRPMVEVSPEEREYERWVDSWTPPAQVVYVNQQDSSHQEHLAEQARMFYLYGRKTPPTDWFPG